MIVIDASAVVEALVGADVSSELLDAMTGDVEAPHLLDIEVMSALRGLSLCGRINEPTAQRAWQDFQDLTIHRHEFAMLSARIWALRAQFTTYDATYLALAEALDAPLYTCDAKLATNGNSANIIVIPTSREVGAYT